MTLQHNKAYKNNSFEYHSVKFPAHKTLFTDTIQNAFDHGYYELEELNQIDQIVQNGEIILEIGGGIGLISTLCARHTSTKSVTSYEANPNLVDYMKKVHKLNNVEVDVINAVLLPFPSAAEVDFYIRQDFWASSLNSEPWGYEKSVKVKTLDFQLELDRIKPSMLIVDIEGGEIELFSNINLDIVNKVFIEIHQDVLGRSGVKRIFDEMSARGFHYDQWHSSGSVILFSHIDRDKDRKKIAD